MIELRNYKRMHVYRVSRARSSKRTRPSQSGGGRVYEIKTLHSNVAPEEGGGAYSRGEYNRASTVYTVYPHSHPSTHTPYHTFWEGMSFISMWAPETTYETTMGS